MDLLGTPLLVLAVLLALAAPVGALLLWGRVHGADPLRAAQRIGLLLVCQLTAVLLASVALNHQFAFYESWSDLLGQDDGGGVVQSDPTPVALRHERTAHDGRLAPLPGLTPIDGRQRVTRETVTGPRSGVRAQVTVVTPPGYAADPLKRYPVVMFLPGYPGSPSTWIRVLGLVDAMDAGIASGRVAPFVAVLPQMNIAGTRDLECSDLPGAPAAGTWLGEDVPRIVASQLRTLPTGPAWGVTGYSTGGFCSAKLALQHPTTFGSSAVLSGYFTPSGDLLGASPALAHRNDPTWLVAHGRPPAIRMLAVYSAQDPETAQPTEAFLTAAAHRPSVRVDSLRLARGGHNTGVWQGVLPQVLAWLLPPARTP